MKRVLAAAAVAAATLSCGGDEPRFDMNHPPAWLQRLDRLGTPVRPDEVRGDCFRPFTGRCQAEVLPSRGRMRKAVLRLAAGDEVQLQYLPAEGTPVSMVLDRAGDAKLRVRKSGGTLVVDCTRPHPTEGCMLALLEER